MQSPWEKRGCCEAESRRPNEASAVTDVITCDARIRFAISIFIIYSKETHSTSTPATSIVVALGGAYTPLSHTLHLRTGTPPPQAMNKRC